MKYILNPTSYSYFTALSNRIGTAVEEIKSSDPEAFSYRGMDLSHAFELKLYFGLANEVALHRLHESGGAETGGARFTGELAFLVARHWFGNAAARAARARLKHWVSYLRPMRAFLGRGKRARSGSGDKRETFELLLFVTSMRFARYMMPVADAWKGRCAFLVGSGETELRAALEAEGYAVVVYRPTGPGMRHLGAALARHMPGIALLADEIEQAVRSVNARVILLPEGNATDDEVVNQVGRHIGVKVACLQHGWSPLIHTGFRNMHYDAMLVWGQGFADLLVPYNPRQKFIPVGNHMLFETFGAPAHQQQAVVIFSMGMGLWMTEEDENLLMSLAPHIAERMPEHIVYVRPHPRHPFSDEMLDLWAKYPNIRVAAWPDVSLAEVLSRSRAAVSVYSSTILESIASGTVPVIFNMTTMPRFMPDVDKAGAGVEVRLFQEAGDALIRLLRDADYARSFEPAMAAFQKEYFAARGEVAIGNIVSALEGLIAGA